jgi:hypothetical protein
MGDVFEDIREHLDERRYLTAQMIMARLQRGHGNSAGMVSQPTDKVDGRRFAPMLPIGSGSDPDFIELDKDLRRLPPSERSFMAYLVKHRELPLVRGWDDWGRRNSGFKTRKTSRAVTIGRVIAMLDVVGSIWFPPMEAG